MITILEPASGASFTAPATVIVKGDHGPMTSWELFKGTTSVNTGGASTGADWTFTLSALSAGSYTVMVTGGKGGTASVSFTVVTAGGG